MPFTRKVRPDLVYGARPALRSRSLVIRTGGDTADSGGDTADSGDGTAGRLLNDPALYDDMRRLGAFGGFGGGRPGGARPGPGGYPGGPPGAGGGQSFDFTDFDIGGLGGLGDLFSSMFGGQGGTRRPRGPEPGQSVEMSLEIPFRTAALGGHRRLDARDDARHRDRVLGAPPPPAVAWRSQAFTLSEFR